MWGHLFGTQVLQKRVQSSPWVAFCGSTDPLGVATIAYSKRPNVLGQFFFPTLLQVARATNVSPQFLCNARAECDEVMTGRQESAREMCGCMPSDCVTG